MFSDRILKISRHNSDGQHDWMHVVTVVSNFIFSTFMRTSCAFGGATSTSSIENGLLASHITAALHLITCKQSKEGGNGTCICQSSRRHNLAFVHLKLLLALGAGEGKLQGKTPNPKAQQKSQHSARCKPVFSPTKIPSDTVRSSAVGSSQQHV